MWYNYHRVRFLKHWLLLQPSMHCFFSRMHKGWFEQLIYIYCQKWPMFLLWYVILIKKRLFVSGKCKRVPQNRDRCHTQRTRFRLFCIITDDDIWSRWKPVTAPVSCLYLQVWFCHTKMSQKLSQTHKRCVFWFLVNPFLVLNQAGKWANYPLSPDKNQHLTKSGWLMNR